MVKWLNKKDRARLQFEYHKGTIEARKAFVQEMFDWGVTYEYFCEDWLEEIARTVANETDEEMKKARSKPMRRVTPSEDYFWDVICRSIYTDQSYRGNVDRDGEGNVVTVQDPDGHSLLSHYEYPLVWMCGHCRFLLEANPDLQDHTTRSYGEPKKIPHSTRTRIFRVLRILHRYWREVVGFFGLVYLFETFREIVLKLIP